MTDRVLHYYQAITDPAFAKYMIEQTGLSPQLQEIAWDFRNYQGDTDFFADRAQMPLKRFNATAAGIHIRLMDELLRLALIGWRTEQNRHPRQ